jgi:hypothetical protein
MLTVALLIRVIEAVVTNFAALNLNSTADAREFGKAGRSSVD